MLKLFFASLALLICTSAQAFRLHSEHAIVISDETGQVLFEKGADAPVPIASLTKLITAMVVLDSKPAMDDVIAIDTADVDALKHSTSRVPVGARLSRNDVLRLALMSSDNRAAAALARTYPGGQTAFLDAVQAKLHALGMANTVIREPSGLSPENTSTAADLARLAQAASRYPEIADITTNVSDVVRMNGRNVLFHNTNRLVGARGWDILLSKTGFTNEAGRCLIMRIKQAGKSATLVLLNASGTASRAADALNVRRLLAGELSPKALARR
jgi:D-alanyl-D-alanine carboxypeptidase/D-alanyl-D-alanine endopeptidase (penicillin-binding protein 7)